MPRSQNEFRLQVAIADRIRATVLPGVFWFAIPNGEDRPKKINPKTGKWYSPTGQRVERMGGVRGLPDIALIIEGRAVGLELKDKGKKLSKDQEQVRDEWTLAGGLYHFADTYDAAVQFLEMVGAIKPDRSRINNSEAA